MSGIREYLSLLKGNVLVLLVSLLIWNFMLQLVSTYEALYIFALGGSGVSLGFLSTIQTLSSTFLRIPGGYLADKRGRRRIIGLAAIIASLGYLFYFFAQNWLWLLPGVLFLSFIGLAEPAVEAIKADSVKPEERGRGYAMMSTLPQIPAMIAPAIGGIIIADRASDLGINLSGMRMAYIMLFVGVIAAGLIRLIFLKDIYRPQEEASGLGPNMFKDVYDTIITSPNTVKRLLMLSGFFMFCFHLDASVRSVYAINVRGLSTVEWGLIVSTTLVLSSFTAFIVGWIVDRYGRKMVFVPAIVLLAVSSLIFAVSNSFPTFLLSRIIGSVGLYGRMVSFQVLIADSIPVSIRGRIMGVFNIFHSMGSSTAILVSGLLYDVAPVLPFYTSAIALILASLVAVKLVQEPAYAQI